MGMFGSIGKAVSGYFDGPIPWADRLSAAGAALGGDAQASAAIRQHAVSLLKAQQEKAQQDAVFKQIADMMQPTYQDAPGPTVARQAGLIGGQAAQTPVGDVSMPLPGPEASAAAPAPAPYQYQFPQRTSNGLTIDDPRMASVTLLAAKNKIPLQTMIEVMRAQQAEMAQASDGSFYNKKNAALAGTRTANRVNVNGTIADLNDPTNTNRVISEAPVKGAMPVYDNLGHVIDWTLPVGARTSLQAAAEANQTGQTRGALQTIQMPDGSTRQMLGRDFVGGPVGGGGKPPRGTAFGPAPSGMGTSQSPADAAYANNNAKAASELYQGIQTAAQKAPSEIAKYTRLGELLNGYEGGKFSPAMKDFSSAANSLGFKIDKNLPNKEAAAAITNQLALSLRDPSNGGGMPGAMSDADRNFLIQSVPGLMQTAAGRKSMVEAQVKVLQRNQDVGAKARQWQDRFGRLDKPDATGKHFQDYLDMWSAAHPLFAHQ